MDAAAVSLTVHSTLALAALGAFLKLGPDSGFCSHSKSATSLANKLFDRLAGELEIVLAPLVESDIDIERVLVDADGSPFDEAQPRIRINEKFRDTLDNYLTNGREWLADYRAVREMGRRLDSWVKQLRRFTCLALVLTSLLALVALLDSTATISMLDAFHIATGTVSVGTVAAWGYYAIRVFLEANPLSDLEAKYAHL